ncbi:cytoplasmic polyadenylation element-binding protein 2-like isoform X2 [Anolis carolinensis]|uniref:cytoplasmic polyadenylation element-binding protein 2-like isoform X2 n=1 Tax=Anolis carolinensis TaxID=28377 RepID=UPI002F2B16EB
MESPPHNSGGGGHLLGSFNSSGAEASVVPSSPPPPLPGFGTPWSVQTSSPPPPPPQPAPNAAMAPPPSPEPPENGSGGNSSSSFYAAGGMPSSINPAFFQSFSPVSTHAGSMGPFGSPFSTAPPPQINVPQQQQQQPARRSPVSPQLQQQHHHQHQAAVAAAAFLQQRNSYNHHQPLLKPSPWSNHQSSGWSTGNMSWGSMHGRDHRRTGNVGIPGTVNQISPLKKPFSGNVIAPPKFTRSTPSLTPKSWIEDNVFRTDNNSNTLLPLQDRNRMYDSLNMHSLENSLIDIMRAEHDPLKGMLLHWLIISLWQSPLCIVVVLLT